MVGATLDYGCGRCHDLNNKHFPSDGYDPHYRPDGIRLQVYDTILCNFVLNTLPSKLQRWFVVVKVQYLLSPGGLAYFSVRNDKKQLKGWTSKGTWQGFVNVPGGELIHKASSYRLYRLTKDDETLTLRS